MLSSFHKIDQRAPLMRSIFLWAFLFLFAGATGVAHAQTSPSQDELKLFHLLNQECQKAGLPELQWDNHLAKSAGGHALLLAEHQGLSHQFSGEPQLGERVGATGLRFTVSAENVASAQTVEDAHKGLMNSPPHRANILSPEFNAVGLAVISRAAAVYVAQNFAYVLPVYWRRNSAAPCSRRSAMPGRKKGFPRSPCVPTPNYMKPHARITPTPASCSGNSTARPTCWCSLPPNRGNCLPSCRKPPPTRPCGAPASKCASSRGLCTDMAAFKWLRHFIRAVSGEPRRSARLGPGGSRKRLGLEFAFLSARIQPLRQRNSRPVPGPELRDSNEPCPVGTICRSGS